MGTRNLTCVIKDSKVRVAQYGQWDGYYGVRFLKSYSFDKLPKDEVFIKQLKRLEEKR